MKPRHVIEQVKLASNVIVAVTYRRCSGAAGDLFTTQTFGEFILLHGDLTSVHTQGASSEQSTLKAMRLSF